MSKEKELEHLNKLLRTSKAETEIVSKEYDALRVKISSKQLETLEVWKKRETAILENYSQMEHRLVDNKQKWTEIHQILKEKPKLETEDIKLLKKESIELETYYTS